MPDQFKIDVDADGIALITWDMPGRSMNLIDVAAITELAALVEKVAGDAAIKGAVITSAKETFSGGADLTLLEMHRPIRSAPALERVQNTDRREIPPKYRHIEPDRPSLAQAQQSRS